MKSNELHYSCPMPLLKTKKAIEKLASGQILEILGTDPGSRNDLPGWANRMGHQYLGDKEDEGFLRFYVQKK
ncbi:MAG: sulfurtransferase TusA family protein [Deltaproteobacteria bacterium]|nr:sulfurtransferase TusA family protein [Deltaproteobacteria bacterium]